MKGIITIALIVVLGYGLVWGISKSPAHRDAVKVCEQYDTIMAENNVLGAVEKAVYKDDIEEFESKQLYLRALALDWKWFVAMD